MSCLTPDHRPDWKAYALGEMDKPARREAEAHAASCADCREELAALRLTLGSLAALREEEIPRRIAFVSDKVFEPRWWRRMLTPNFAAACVIAAAILVHAFAHSPANGAQIQAEVNAAVAKAVVQVEAQQAEQTTDILDRYGRQFTQMYVRTTGLERQ